MKAQAIGVVAGFVAGALVAFLALGRGPTPDGLGALAGGGDSGSGAPLARWRDGQIDQADLEQRLSDELRMMDIQYKMDRYERLHDALDGAVEDALLDAEVKRRSLGGRDALFAIEVDAKLQQPTDAQLQTEFARFVQQMPDATFEAAAPFIRRELLQGAKDERREAFLGELRQASGLVLNFPYPDLPRIQIPLASDDPALGPADAPVTIVEFGGYQCYYCRRVDAVLHKLVDSFPGKVRLVYKDFPIAGHDAARRAAIAARCAGEQHRYWELSDVLLANQGRLERDHLEGYARDQGLDLDLWRACLEDPAMDARVDASLKAGRDAGVTSTPTFFVDGLMLTGAHSYERFAALVNQELGTRESAPASP